MAQENKEQCVYILQYECKSPNSLGTNCIYGVYYDKYKAFGSMYQHFYTKLDTAKSNEVTLKQFNDKYDVELSSDSMCIRSKENYMTEYTMFSVKKETVQQ